MRIFLKRQLTEREWKSAETVSTGALLELLKTKNPAGPPEFYRNWLVENSEGTVKNVTKTTVLEPS